MKLFSFFILTVYLICIICQVNGQEDEVSTLIIKATLNFFQIYSDVGTGADTDISVWRANVSEDLGYYPLGDVAMNYYGPPTVVYVVSAEGDELQPPVDYEQVWDDGGSGGDQDGSFWKPVPPPGYICLGHVAQNGYDKPSTDLMRCVKTSLVMSANAVKVWDDRGSGADRDIGVWEVVTDPNDPRGATLNLFVSIDHYDDPGTDHWVLYRPALKSGLFTRQNISLNTPALFAPKIFLHPDEYYFPGSPLTFLENVHPENGFLVTNEPLGCDSCTDPAFLDGVSPAGNTVPAYALIVQREIEGEPTNVTDFVYWTFYPYNNGKRICIGLYLDVIGCIGGYSTFGNHVGDWEYVVIRFIDGYATKVYYSFHSGGLEMNWGYKLLPITSDNHLIAFAALGSHGLYPDATRHTYQELPNGDTLNDDTGFGVQWDTWNNLTSFNWQNPGTYSGDLEFLNIQERWGNPKSGCDFSEMVSDECVLNDGPVGPMFHGISDPSSYNFQ